MFTVKHFAESFTKPAEVRTFNAQGPWSSEFEAQILAEGCEEVGVGRGWTAADSLGLAQLKVVKYVVANTFPPADITPLQEMSWLKGLSIGDVKLSGSFDFSKLKSLEAASVRWQPKKMAGMFEHTGIKRLLIDSYPFNDLSPFAAMTGLEVLEVRSLRALRSLRGIEGNPRLNTFRVVFGPNLVVHPADQLPPTIEKVEFYSCKSLTRIDPLGRLPNLKRLQFDKCGHIESLAPLQACRELTALYCYDTISDDGDMGFLAELPKLIDVRMQWRKHFRPSKAEIDAAVLRNRAAAPSLPEYLQPPQAAK